MSDSTHGSKFSSASLNYVSFDGGVRVSTTAYIPDRYRFWDPSPHAQYGISRGAGLSYTAASFSRDSVTVDHARFNRILDWDSTMGIVEVETGITLGEIYSFAMPRGFFLPVQPGHPKITAGGCIGADVHGKNQFRDGTFVSVVESIRLFHPDHGILELSRSTQPLLFALTCGGYGLTGNVISARLRLSRIESASVQLRITPIGNIFDLGPALEKTAQQSDLVYSWHDFTAQGEAFGKGFLVDGSFRRQSEGSEIALTSSESGLDARTRGNLRFSFFNRWTTPLFNRLYHASVRFGPAAKELPLHEFLFPVYKKEVYFQLFGSRGFHEIQVIIPLENFPAFLMDVKTYLQKQPVPVTLASAKLFRGTREFLRFTGNGICLAMNFPRDTEGGKFASFLDAAMLAHGGWPNIIKDSRLSGVIAAQAYPEYQRFRDEIRRHDPRRIYRSALSERLEL